MTNKEYITYHLGRFGLADTDIDFILLEAGIDPEGTVSTAEEKQSLKLAMHSQVPLLIAGLNNVSEGGYSVTWNIEGIKAWYSVLSTEIGEDDQLATPKPVIRDKSNMW
ncbi:MAG: hypothetical protein J7527_14675 [Chitinophagaceae bacterium]|nr:hypothetical protein [Chitinophagaceae bacterium]